MLDVSKIKWDAEDKKAVETFTEQFDISGKIDTANPIYKFYDRLIQKYLQRLRPNMRRVTDPQGVEWFETTLSKRDAERPVEAFGALPPNRD